MGSCHVYVGEAGMTNGRQIPRSCGNQTKYSNSASVLQPFICIAWQGEKALLRLFRFDDHHPSFGKFGSIVSQILAT